MGASLDSVTSFGERKHPAVPTHAQETLMTRRRMR
jgi:hypothetical protein